jgi:hypothetical protein
VPVDPESARLPEMAPRHSARAVSCATAEGVRESSDVQQPEGAMAQQGTPLPQIADNSLRHFPDENWSDEAASCPPDAGDNESTNEATALSWPERRSEDWLPQHEQTLFDEHRYEGPIVDDWEDLA